MKKEYNPANPYASIPKALDWGFILSNGRVITYNGREEMSHDDLARRTWERLSRWC